jgi:hypothetical protein
VHWFALEDIPWDELSPGHLKRLRHAVQWFRDRATPTYFDGMTYFDGIA